MPPLAFLLTMVVAVWLGSDKLQYIFEMMTLYGIPLHFGMIQLFLAIPEILMHSLPAAVLLASVVVLGMGMRKELLYLRVCGYSFARIIRTPLLIGLLASVLYFALAQFVVPTATESSSKLWLLGLYKSELPLGQSCLTREQQSADGKTKQILYVGHYTGDRLKNIVLIEPERKAAMKITHAPHGVWWRGKWILKDGTTFNLTNETSNQVFKFEKLVVPSMKDLTEALKANATRPTKLPLVKLTKYHNTPGLTAHQHDLLDGSFWDQILTPLACLCMIIAGATAAVGTGRNQALKIVFPAVTIIAYYFLKSSVSALVENARIDPTLGGCLPTATLAIVTTIYLMCACGDFRLPQLGGKPKSQSAA